MKQFILALVLLLSACSQSPEPLLAVAPIEEKALAAAPSASSDILDQLSTAHMALAAPVEADVEDTVTVQLYIDPRQDPLVDQALRSNTIRSTVLISPVVTASLIAPDFEVLAVTPTTQAISHREATLWVWQLAPKKYGASKIHVSISARVVVGDDKVERFIKTYDHTIDITITPFELLRRWLASHWEWVFATILVPAGGWMFAKLKKRFR